MIVHSVSSVFLFAAGFAFVSALFGDEKLPTATVNVEVVGAFGGSVRGAVVRLRSVGKMAMTARGDGPVFTAVPYGRYTLVAFDSGGAVAERELVVNSAEVWVKVGLSFPAGERAWPGGDLAVSGTIVPFAKGQSDWWVRVEGVFLYVRRDAPVSATGRFSIRGLEMGAYTLQVFNGAKLRHVQSLELDTNSEGKDVAIYLSDGLSVPEKQP